MSSFFPVKLNVRQQPSAPHISGTGHSQKTVKGADNLGTDVYQSGKVAAAREAAMPGGKAIAV